MTYDRLLTKSLANRLCFDLIHTYPSLANRLTRLTISCPACLNPHRRSSATTPQTKRSHPRVRSSACNPWPHRRWVCLLMSIPPISVSLPFSTTLQSDSVDVGTDSKRPHPESHETELKLRGGERGSMCPGRLCFIIPCPIPCDCECRGPSYRTPYLVIALSLPFQT